MSAALATLGGRPAFPDGIRFIRPDLPDFAMLEPGLREIVSSGMLTKGNLLREFESRISEHIGVRHAVGVSSCTLGLALSYQGLGLTGDVVVPSFTWMATVSALRWCGLRPVFADVDLHTTNLTPALAEATITPRTTAIVAVHNFGSPADIAGLVDLANRRGLKLLFDAAHGFGALYRGSPVGRDGDAHVYSLSPTKLLVAGEGGIVATNDDDLAEWIRRGREYGNDGTGGSSFPGLNARMTEMNALLGLHSLDRLETVAKKRNANADTYRSCLADVPGLEFQLILPGCRSSYKDFSVVVDPQEFGMSRDELREALLAEHVESGKYYSPPAHRNPAYREFAPPDGALPNTDHLSDGSISLPIGSHLTEEQVRGVSDLIIALHDSATKVREALRERRSTVVA